MILSAVIATPANKARRVGTCFVCSVVVARRFSFFSGSTYAPRGTHTVEPHMSLTMALDLASSIRSAILCCFNRGPARKNRTTTNLQAVRCALSHTRSQHVEDMLLLPTLLLAVGMARPGVFIELGALDGTTFSNTLVLERCFNWTGVLIEANPFNFQRLAKSRRVATKVHAAVCNGTGTVRMTKRGGPMANHLDRSARDEELVDVPCRPLTAILKEAGHESADFLSLDVQGAELSVLRTARLSSFKLIMTEAYGGGTMASARRHVADEMANAGLVRQMAIGVYGSELYAPPEVQAVPVRTWQQANRLANAGFHMRRCRRKKCA